MTDIFNFTFESIQKQYEFAIKENYEFITCYDYASDHLVKGKKQKRKTIINRVDIDFSVKKAEKIGQMFNQLGIKGSFFRKAPCT